MAESSRNSHTTPLCCSQEKIMGMSATGSRCSAAAAAGGNQWNAIAVASTLRSRRAHWPMLWGRRMMEILILVGTCSVGVKRWLAHLGCLLLVVKDEKEEGIRGHILPMAPELCKICRSWAISSSLPPLPPPAPQEKTTTTDADADACGTSRRSTRVKKGLFIRWLVSPATACLHHQ
uniref:Uncharacterized protein n=1 Tax=Oryza sativa subsp. japonica TaxID=39947 RepID=Q69ST4_ORYSJ|nr:hypothetical protein [Oryza sativa Japonica Group]